MIKFRAGGRETSLLPGSERIPLREFTALTRILEHLDHGDTDAAVAEFTREDLEPRAFADYAIWHRVSDWIHAALERAGALERVHRRTRHWLVSAHARHRTRTDLLLGALAPLAAALDSAGVRFIILKGFPVAERLYGSVYLRPQDDIDILVPRQDVARACAALTACGYREKRLSALSRFVASTFEYSVSLHSGAVALDLHWRFRHRPAYRIDYAAVWDTRSTASVGGRDYAVLSREYELVFLMLSIVDDLERGAGRLKYLLDLRLALREGGTGIDWESFFARRRAENLAAICVNALVVLEHLLPWRADVAALAGCLDRNQALVAIRDRDHAVALMTAPRRTPRNRLWFSGLYPSPAPLYWGWLLVRSGWRHLALVTDKLAAR